MRTRLPRPLRLSASRGDPLREREMRTRKRPRDRRCQRVAPGTHPTHQDGFGQSRTITALSTFVNVSESTRLQQTTAGVLDFHWPRTLPSPSIHRLIGSSGATRPCRSQRQPD